LNRFKTNNTRLMQRSHNGTCSVEDDEYSIFESSVGCCSFDKWIRDWL